MGTSTERHQKTDHLEKLSSSMGCQCLKEILAGLVYDPGGQKKVEYAWNVHKTTGNVMKALTIWKWLQIAKSLTSAPLISIGNSSLLPLSCEETPYPNNCRISKVVKTSPPLRALIFTIFAENKQWGWFLSKWRGSPPHRNTKDQHRRRIPSGGPVLHTMTAC